MYFCILLPSPHPHHLHPRYHHPSPPGLGFEAFGDIDVLMSHSRPTPSLPSSLSASDRRKKGPHSSEHSKNRGETTSPSVPTTPVGINLREWKGSDDNDGVLGRDGSGGGGGGEERGKLVRISPEQHQSDASARLSRGLATTSTTPINGPFAAGPGSFVPIMAPLPLHAALTRKSTTVRPASASRQGLGPGHAMAGVRTSTNSNTNMGNDGVNVGGTGVAKKSKKRERQQPQQTTRPSSAPSSSSSSRHSHSHSHR